VYTGGSLKRGLSRRSVIHAQIDDVTDRQIDQLVYDLYSLTDKEVRIGPDPAQFARERRELREARKRLHPPPVVPPSYKLRLGPFDMSALGRYPFCTLPCDAPYCVPGGVRVVSASPSYPRNTVVRLQYFSVTIG
jgi:hypothetical protein